MRVIIRLVLGLLALIFTTFLSAVFGIGGFLFALHCINPVKNALKFILAPTIIEYCIQI